MAENRYELNKQLAQMLKGGVIMDVTTPEQAKIAEAWKIFFTTTSMIFLLPTSISFNLVFWFLLKLKLNKYPFYK